MSKTMRNDVSQTYSTSVTVYALSYLSQTRNAGLRLTVVVRPSEEIEDTVCREELVHIRPWSVELAQQPPREAYHHQHRGNVHPFASMRMYKSTPDIRFV